MHIKNDDFGFANYLGNAVIDVEAKVLPMGIESPKPQWKAPKVNALKWSLMALMMSGTLFTTSVVIARSSAHMDSWRHHALSAAWFSGLFMTASGPMAYYFWRQKDD